MCSLIYIYIYIYISTWDNVSMYITHLHRIHLHSLLPTNLCYFGTYPSMYKVVYLDLHGQGGNSRVYKKGYQGGPKLWFINNRVIMGFQWMYGWVLGHIIQLTWKRFGWKVESLFWVIITYKMKVGSVYVHQLRDGSSTPTSRSWVVPSFTPPSRKNRLLHKVMEDDANKLWFLLLSKVR